MKSVNYPLALPLDFLDEFKQAAKEAGLSTAAAIRQSAKLGLPKFRTSEQASVLTIDTNPPPVCTRCGTSTLAPSPPPAPLPLKPRTWSAPSATW
jgi:hypothetical protein